MKKYVIIFISILVIGFLAILAPRFIADYRLKKQASEFKIRQKEQNEQLRQIESDKSIVEQMEIPFEELEPELFDNNQLLFKDVEELYKYFTFNQVDQIKQKLQFYIQQNLKDIKECTIKVDTISNNNNVLSFLVAVQNYKDITADIKKDDKGVVIDISLFQSQ